MHTATSPPDSKLAYPHPVCHDLRWNAQLADFGSDGTPLLLSQYESYAPRHASSAAVGGSDGGDSGGNRGGGEGDANATGFAGVQPSAACLHSHAVP